MSIEPARSDFVPSATLAALSRIALAENGGLTERAVEALVKRLQGDATLLRQVIAGAVHDAVSTRVQHAVRGERAAIIHRATDPRANVVALARGLMASLLDMPLAGGARLRDCDRAFVQREAERFERLAVDCTRKARFLAHVAQRVPDGCTVGQVMNDERALELWKEIS